MPLAVGFIGPSGVGKSTLIASLSKLGEKGPIQFFPLRKETTRVSRQALEIDRFDFITEDEFSERKASGKYIVTYTSFLSAYGIVKPDFEATPNLIPIIDVPTDLLPGFRAYLEPAWRVFVICLIADTNVIRERLLKRGDPGTLATIEARVKSAVRSRENCADFVVDASRPQQAVLQSVLDILAHNVV